MCPRSAHKPGNLMSQQRAVVKKASTFQENVSKGRARIEGILDDETILQYILRTQKTKKEQPKQAAPKLNEVPDRPKQEPKCIVSTNPFDLLG